MGDQRQRVDRLAGDRTSSFDEVALAIADLLVVERGIALAAALELVVEIDDHLGQRQLEGQQHALRIEVLHRLEGPAPARRELHQGADVLRRRDHADLHPRLGDRLDVAERRQLRRVVDDDLAAIVGQHARGTRPTARMRSGRGRTRARAAPGRSPCAAGRGSRSGSRSRARPTSPARS